MKCPRDQRLLAERSREEHRHHGCATCDGVFIGQGVLHDHLGHVDDPATGRIDYALLPASTLRCPADGQTMRALVYHGIEIDLCPACEGVWLDADEYDAIVRERSPKKRDDSFDLDHPGGGSSSSSSSSSSSASPEAGATDGAGGGDFDFDVVLEFVGDAIGSIFDGLL